MLRYARANDLTIGVLAVVAQRRRKRSLGEKYALQIVRKRMEEFGQSPERHVRRLGNPNGAAAHRRAGKGNHAAVAKARANADQRAKDVAAVVICIRPRGAKTLAIITEDLNSREMVTPRGGRWHASSVANLLRMLET